MSLKMAIFARSIYKKQSYLTMKISDLYQSIYSLCLLLLFMCVVPASAWAQKLTAYRGTVSEAYNFWFYTPPMVPGPNYISVPVTYPDTTATVGGDMLDALAKKPLVVFLHGASLCGNRLERVRTYGTLDAINRGLKLDAYVLAPQCNSGSWMPSKINRLIDWAIDHYSIDTTRIYVLGMSLGGYGTLDYAANSPGRVAAAVALCGGASTNELRGLCDVPLCIVHGTGDRAVSWKCSQGVVDRMKSYGDTSRLLYYLLPKKSHGDLARYLYVPKVYEWLFKHQLTEEGRPVSHDYDFDYSDTRDVYTVLGKPDHPLIVENDNPKGKGEEGSMAGVHVVRRGDSLSKIANTYHTTVARLCKLNGLKRTSTLRIGQKVKY